MPLAIVVASGLSVILGAQVPDTLDLTQARPSSGLMTAGPVTGPATGPEVHTPREESPVRLTFEWIDRDAYRDNETFAFRIALVNISSKPVTLPWEPAQDRVGTDADLLRAVVTIDVHTANGEQVIPIATLYGSKADRNSTKLLQPGARAEIIAKGTWRLAAGSSKRSAQLDYPAAVNVSARIIFASSIDDHVYRDAVSTNRMPVVVDRPDQR